MDPSSEARRQKLESSTTLTFRDAVEEYIKKRVSTMRSRRDTEREIRRLAARWSRLSVTELGRSEVVKFMDKVGARTPATAHRQSGYLRALFNWLRERGVIETWPCNWHWERPEGV